MGTQGGFELIMNNFGRNRIPLVIIYVIILWKYQEGPGSVRFGYSSGVERFERFRFSVPAVPLQKGFPCFSTLSQERTVPVSVPEELFRRFRFRFREKRFRRFRFPVPVRFLSHPDFIIGMEKQGESDHVLVLQILE